MLVRAATTEDADAIATVHVESWRTTYKGLLPEELLAGLSVEARADMWRQAAAAALKDDTRFAPFVVEEPGEGIIGFAHVGREREEESAYDAELYAIYLLQSHQGKGVGRLLFTHAVRHLKERGHSAMRVWVLEGNPAQRFYQRMGGEFGESKLITIGAQEYTELSYGWPDISGIA